MLEEIITRFINYCRISNFSEKSIQSLTTRLREFQDFVSSNTIPTIIDISYRHLRVFVADFKSPSIHIKKNRIWMLRQFFHFLKLNGLIEKNIATEIPFPKIEKTIPRFLTAEEFNQILEFLFENSKNANGLRNLIMVMMMGILGIRISALVGLNIEDVDIETGLVRINEKGGKKRPMIMPEVLCLLIQSYLQILPVTNGPLFLSKRNKRISKRRVQDTFKKASEKCGIDKDIHSHLFRHTAATHLNKVAGITITQHVLGHAWRKNTLKYAHLNPDQYAVYMKQHPFMKGEK